MAQRVEIVNSKMKLYGNDALTKALLVKLYKEIGIKWLKPQITKQRAYFDHGKLQGERLEKAQ